MLTAHEIYKHITPVIERYKELSAQYDTLQTVLGVTVDSPFMNAVWQLFDDYESLVAYSIGDGGEHSWLSWYIWENECGKRELPAAVGKRQEKPVRSVKDLATLIYQSQPSV